MKNPPFATGGPDTSENMINYLQSEAGWARLPGKRKVIWNRLDGSLKGTLDSSPLVLSNVSAAIGGHLTSRVAQEKV